MSEGKLKKCIFQNIEYRLRYCGYEPFLMKSIPSDVLTAIMLGIEDGLNEVKRTNEGEFAKRAKILIEREINEPQENGSPDPYYYGHRDGVKELLKVLDEAAKEFPQDLLRFLRWSARDAERVTLPREDCVRLLSWINKWFGLAEKEKTQ